MLFAIKNELSLRNNELKNKTLETLYFGGGTPSILEVDEIKMLMDEILKYFDFSKVEYSKIFLDKDRKWCIPRRPAEDYSKLNLFFK